MATSIAKINLRRGGDPKTEDETLRPALDKAIEIIEAGQTFEYIFGVWQKRHKGDGPLGKALLLSCGSQSVSNSKGIHVIATGEGGYGKSDAIRQMGKLLFPQYWKNSGITPQSLYYTGMDMPDGVIVGLDDIVWGSELGVTVKRITTNFQDGATRTTVNDMQGVEVRTAKRIAFWASCADNQADEQLRDRFLMHSVKSNPSRRKEIIKHMQSQDSGEKLPDEYHFETNVCQSLIFDLKQNLFEVNIPFAKRIEFDGDPRAYGMFSDMIRSSAVFRYMKREFDEAGRLIATVEDFENARQLYIDIGGHDRDKYTDIELEVLEAIIINGGVATQADIQKEVGLSSGRVSDILNGRGKEGHGLLYKCKEITVDEGRPKRYKIREGFNPVYKISIGLEEVT